jgi:hypothetical protein
MTGPEDQLRDLFGVLAARQPTASTDGVWLRDRWRRRQRRRVGIATATITAMAVLAGVTLSLPGGEAEQSLVATRPPVPTSSPGLSPPPSPRRPASPAAVAAPPLLNQQTNVRLLVVQGDVLELLDVDSGKVSPVATDSRQRGYSRINATAVGDEVVLVGDDSTGAGGGGGDVLATTAGIGSGLRVIGSSDPHLMPSSNAGRIWLSSVTDADRTTGRPRTELREVDLRGRVRQKVVFDGTFGATPFAGGFLRSVSLERGDGVELVDAQGERSRAWPGGQLLGVWGDHALLSDVPPCDGVCGLRVLTARGELSERRVEVDDPAWIDWQAGGISPDGRLLFSGAPDGDEPSVRVARTDLVTGKATLLEGVRSTRYYGLSPSFSADGRWMFLPDADRTHVNVYDIAEQTSYRVPGEFKEVSSVLVVS